MAKLKELLTEAEMEAIKKYPMKEIDFEKNFKDLTIGEASQMYSFIDMEEKTAVVMSATVIEELTLRAIENNLDLF